MEEDYEASLSWPENENELLDIQGQSEEKQSGEESDDNITSYQKPPIKPSQYEKQKKTGTKRKAGDETPTTTEANIKKTEESIKKLNDHLKRNTCPKPLRYSARANIAADEEFKKDIKALKQKAERGFVEALTRFHYRRLEKQKTKFNKRTRRKLGSLSTCDFETGTASRSGLFSLITRLHAITFTILSIVM